MRSTTQLFVAIVIAVMFAMPAAAQPDLVIDGIWIYGEYEEYGGYAALDESRAANGKGYTTDFEITNIGNETALNGSRTCLYVDGVHVEDYEIECDLEPGDSDWGWFEYDLPCNCTVNVTVCADNYDDVEESDENNNCMTKTWRCPWNFKPPFPNYAPSGMPDFDQKQDNWKNPDTYQWSFCGPVAVANCLWWFDSKYANRTGIPGDSWDNFSLVRDYTNSLSYPGFPPAFPGSPWLNDDHRYDNVDNNATLWPPVSAPPVMPPFMPGEQTPPVVDQWGELVERLAWYMNTDGINTSQPYAGTNITNMEMGIDRWLEDAELDDVLYVHKEKSPDLYWIEAEIKRCQNVILLLGFWTYQEIYLHNATIDPLSTIEPVCTWWHELHPEFWNEHHITDWADSDGDGTLSPYDEIKLEGDEAWYPVQDVTVTIKVTNESDFMYIEYTGGYSNIEEAIRNPVGKWWMEIYPDIWGWYRINGWNDTNEDGNLSSCDHINFTYDSREWHVEEVGTDIVVDLGWRRIGGHYVTVAGVSSEEIPAMSGAGGENEVRRTAPKTPKEIQTRRIQDSGYQLGENKVRRMPKALKDMQTRRIQNGDGWYYSMIALSDPFLDNAIQGWWGDGRVLPPDHPEEYDPTLHNDARYVSHDYYWVEPWSVSPGGDWWIPEYPFWDCLWNFEFMNVPEEFEEVSGGSWMEEEWIETEIEYAIAISPYITVTSVNESGDEIDEFLPGTNVSVKGSGFTPGTYNIWIQPQPVEEDDVLDPSKDPSGSQEPVTVDGSGGFGPIMIWEIPEDEPGYSHWDIVIDRTGGGEDIYNAIDDGLDNVCCYGFHIIYVPEIEVNKTVWNGTAWVKEIDANVSDVLRFRCEIHNSGNCDLTDVYVGDYLSSSLNYSNNATPREPDYYRSYPEYTHFCWYFGRLEPCQTITIEFDAHVIKCGEDENTMYADAWCEEGYVDDEDTVLVTVPCCLGDCYEYNNCTGLIAPNINCTECIGMGGYWKPYPTKACFGDYEPFDLCLNWCPACCNGTDDDSDGEVDWPDDSMCTCALDPSEEESLPPIPEAVTLALVGIGILGIIGIGMRRRKL